MKDIALIEDDIYGDLCFDGPRPKAAKAYDQQGLVLLCASFSKTLAPGYRVGWTAPGRYKPQVESLKFTSSMATATAPQMAIAEFLQSGGYERYLRKLRRILLSQVQQISAAVGRYFPAGTKVTRPQGGYVLWVELPALSMRSNSTAARWQKKSASRRGRSFPRRRSTRTAFG